MSYTKFKIAIENHHLISKLLYTWSMFHSYFAAIPQWFPTRWLGNSTRSSNWLPLALYTHVHEYDVVLLFTNHQAVAGGMSMPCPAWEMLKGNLDNSWSTGCYWNWYISGLISFMNISMGPSGVIKYGWLENPRTQWKFFLGTSPIFIVYFPPTHVW